MNQDSKNINDYLISDTIIDWKEPAVYNLAQELTANESSEVIKARTLFEWVRNNIPHSGDIISDLLTCIASDVLKHQTGICFAKSHLLAALLRAVNIPAGLCYQILKSDSENLKNQNQLILHGLNGIYLTSINKWIRVDARGNTNGINAQFSIEKELLAFAMDSNAGEFIYDTIFSSPVKNVTEKLLKYKTRTEFLGDLPKPF
jgi:transglutaminase-like putative cysteine protease